MTRHQQGNTSRRSPWQSQPSATRASAWSFAGDDAAYLLLSSSSPAAAAASAAAAAGAVNGPLSDQQQQPSGSAPYPSADVATDILSASQQLDFDTKDFLFSAVTNALPDFRAVFDEIVSSPVASAGSALPAVSSSSSFFAADLSADNGPPPRWPYQKSSQSSHPLAHQLQSSAPPVFPDADWVELAGMQLGDEQLEAMAAGCFDDDDLTIDDLVGVVDQSQLTLVDADSAELCWNVDRKPSIAALMTSPGWTRSGSSDSGCGSDGYDVIVTDEVKDVMDAARAETLSDQSIESDSAIGRCASWRFITPAQQQQQQTGYCTVMPSGPFNGCLATSVARRPVNFSSSSSIGSASLLAECFQQSPCMDVVNNSLRWEDMTETFQHRAPAKCDRVRLSTDSYSDLSSTASSPTEDLPTPVGPKGSRRSRSGRTRRSICLWQFLRELLQVPQLYQTSIRWIDRSGGIFKIEDSVRVAKLWGECKNRPAMNYDKLSRSIRQYYKQGIIRKTNKSRRLVFQFCPQYL